MPSTRTCGLIIGVTTLVLLVSSCASNGGGGTSTNGPPPYAAALSDQIKKLMKDGAIPGAVVLIRSREQGDWSATFGTRKLGSDDPISQSDRFRIGSNTKTMTGTVILQLVQEGKLALEDPVSKYQAGVPGGDRITIAELLEMRSGLYSYSFDSAFNATMDNQPQKAWKPDELLAIANSHPPNFAPGTKFEYSNTNTILLGVIIEKLTGTSAGEAFRKRISEPLGLKDTSLPDPTDSSIPNPHPQGYMFGTNVSTIDTTALPADQQAAAAAGTLKPSNVTDGNPSWAWTAGAGISTADDLAVYVKALVGGGLLNREMQKRRLDSILGADPANPAAAGYGYAIAKFGPLLGHDGQLPGFMSFMGHDPDRDITIIVLTNLFATPDGSGAALPIAKAIIAALYAPAGKSPSPRATAP